MAAEHCYLAIVLNIFLKQSRMSEFPFVGCWLGLCWLPRQ